MKTVLKVEKIFDLKKLDIEARVINFDGTIINGVVCVDCNQIPCIFEDFWNPSISIDDGIIPNWTKGVEAKINLFLGKKCSWWILDSHLEVILERYDDYVPNCLSDGDNNYLVMNIDKDGKIENWKFNIDDFTE